MKKITLLLIMIMSTWYLNAQVVAYSFSQSNGTYTEISGGTLLGTETSDDQRFVDPATPAGGTVLTGVGLPIGFNFVFNGVVYDRFAVNNNGWISLGMSSLGAAAVNMNTTSAYTPTRSTSTAVTDELVARISGLGRDLQAQVGSTLRYELTGTAPNQVLIVQFKNYRKYVATGDNFNFQIKLYETSNLVEVVYGTQVNNATSSTYDVGLRASPAATATNFNSRTSTTSWSATTSSVDALGAITMDATIIPASGLTFTWTPPTCPGATGITLTSLTNSSADVTWTQPTPLPSNGYQYVVTSTVGLPTGVGTPSATNMVSATGLTANTTYYVYVRSDCGSSFGNWILSGTFKTLCDEVSAFVQNFDTYPSGTTSLPDCWSKAGTSANVYITTGALAPMSPSNRLYMNVSATTSAYAILAPVSNLQANTHRLKFKAYASTANKSMSIGYFATPGDITSYVEVEPVQLPGTAIASTQEFTIIPTSIPAGVTQLVFNTTQPTPSATTVYIDDVKWEVNSSCVEPTALIASAITNTGATLGWANGGPETVWDIQYGLANFALGTGVMVNGVTVNPHVLNGLTANTNYQFYVRGVCTGPQNSSWSGPFSFKTQCDDVTDFLETFDTYASGTNSLPDCWSRGGTSASTYITTGAVAPMSPSNRLYMFASGTTPTEAYAILPAVSNLQANTHRLKFKAFSTAINRFLQIGYLTDPSDINTFIQLEEVTLPSTVIANTQEFTIVPTGIPAGVKHLSIRNPGFPSSTTTAYLDDVIWEAIPSCPETTTLNATNVTSSAANLSWTEMGTATLWNVEYGVTGFTQGTGTLISGVTTNPYTLSGLNPQTSYSYYVQADCGGTSGTSIWIGPFSFTTACVPYVAPYTQNFDGLALATPYNTMPICWETQVGPDFWTVTNDLVNTGHTYLPNIGDHTTGTANYMWIDASTDITANGMVSPLIDMSGLTSPTVGFWFASNNTNNAINHTIALDVWNGSTWLNLATQTGNFPGWVKVEAVVPSSVPTTTKFRIYATANPAGTSADYFYNDLGVDDFFVIETPVSAPNCSTNLVSTPNVTCGNFSNTLSWDADPIATGYYINVGSTSGGTNIANNVTLSTSSYSFVGEINTTYYWTVTPYNANGSATGCTEQSFTTSSTGCYCPSLPTSNDGLGITNVQLGTTDFATNDVTYFDHSATQVTLPQGLNTNVQISFATGFTYNTYIWIDLNDNYIFDASELVYTGESLSTNPTVLNASFLMPATAAIGVHKMRIVTADFLPASDPCYSGSYGVTLDFSVNIIVSSCTPASATATIVPDCANNQYSVNVNVTDLGSGSPVLSYGTTTLPITATGVITAGPFASGSSNTLTVLHGSDTTCDLPLGNFTYACPPVNDECANPTVLTPGGVFATNQVTGTNVAATSSTQTAPTCAFYQGGDVWYSAVVPASGSLTFEVNPTTGGLTDTGGAVYSGTCSSLTEIACNDSSSASGDHPLIIVTGQTPGSVLYFRVWEYGNDVFGTFLVSAYDASLSASSFDNASFVAYPNPVKDVLNLSYSSEISSVKVINLLGQEVISRKVNNTTSQIDMTSLTAGAYIVNVTVGDVVKTIKVIKQ